jgi:hypothetical protein
MPKLIKRPRFGGYTLQKEYLRPGHEVEVLFPNGTWQRGEFQIHGSDSQPRPFVHFGAALGGLYIGHKTEIRWPLKSAPTRAGARA